MSLHDPMLRQLRSLLLSSSLLLGVLLASGQAQVTTAIRPDGTLGTTVTPRGTVHDITGGTRPGNGSNLFHSFDRFSVGTNDTARFSGPTGIVNILSRVTGGQQSVIDGRLQSTIPGANLYLLNPSGVLFGPNASLDINGSFHVSTADVLRFTDGATFSAHIGERSTLTTAPPVAFGFLGPTPASITVLGSSLGVSEGKAVSVVGGEIQIVGGQLMAPSGRVQIASVASPGEVLASPLEMEPDLQVNAFAHLGQLTLSQNALLNASGNGGGTVLIRSGRLLVDQSSIMADTLGNTNGARKGIDIAVTGDIRHTQGGFITAGSGGAGDAGDVKITAGSLHIDRALIGAGTFGEGRAGDIRIDVGTLTLTNGAVIDSRTLASARRGGTVTVTATDSITIAGRDSFGNASGLFANTFGNGDAGQVAVVTPTLTMHGGQIQAVSFNSGNAGNITLEVGRLTLTGGAQIGSNSLDAGNGGTITITATDAVSLAENAQINASGAGGGTVLIQGGRLTVTNASITAFTVDRDGAKIGIDLRLAEDVVVDNSGIAAGSAGHGDVGEIRVEAGTLTLSRGAVVASLAMGAGKGGDITVSARESVSISGRNDQGTPSSIATFAATEPGRLSLSAPSVTIAGGIVGTPSLAAGGFVGGRAGDIVVKADNLTISGVGGISSGTATDSDGGSITIETGRLTVTGGAQISASSGFRDPATGTIVTGRGAAGNVTVAARESVSLSGQSSGLSSNTFGSGNAGVISLSTPKLMSDGAQISSATFGSGAGGNVVVHVGTLTLTEGAGIDSTTFGAGHGGTLTVTATEGISISGRDSEGKRSGLFSTTLSSGDAGRLFISAPTLHMDAGRIQAAAASESRGNAGNIEVKVGMLTLTGGAQLSSSTSGPGQGGTLTVMATESMSITGRDGEGFRSGLFSSTDSSGNAGGMLVSAPVLIMDGGRIVARTLGDGNAGNIGVQTGRLDLTGGAQIFNGTGTLVFVNGMPTFEGTGGPGRGGRLTVSATDAIVITGQDPLEGFQSGLFSNAQKGTGRAGELFVTAPSMTMHGGRILASTESASSGDGGNLTLEVGRLVLMDGAQISSSTSGAGQGGTVTVKATDAVMVGGSASGIFGSASSSGNAGQVMIVAPTLHIQEGAVIDSSTSGDGQGGSIAIQAQHIELSAGGAISTRSSSKGDAGNIVLQASEVFRSRNGAVTTEAEQADGGNVQLTVGSRVELRKSQITATVKTGVGKGGNITIDPQFVVMQDSQVRADAFGGPGGNVRIVAGVFLADPASQVSASSALGINGVVDIQSPVTSISGAVAPLPQTFAPVAELLRDRCAGRLREGRVSRLVIGGRDGVPSEPRSLLLSPLIQTDPREHGEQGGTSARIGQVQERARYVQAGGLEGLDAACARWTGQKGTAVGSKR